jgi:predicted nucleotidyltransferase
VDIQFPTQLHRAVLDDVLAELRADVAVLGVLLCGSLARGTARDDSDIDLLIVLADQEADDGAKRFTRKRFGAIEVEQSARTPAGWIRQFSPSRIGDESWGYAFLDGVVLHDPHGAVAQLVVAADDAHASYRVPDHLTAHYAWLWRHIRPKMEAVLRGGDATEIGWAAAVMTAHLTETLWAINGRPLPSRDLGCLQRHLDDLTVPREASTLVREMLQAAPKECLRLQLRLLDLVTPYLQQDEAGNSPGVASAP